MSEIKKNQQKVEEKQKEVEAGLESAMNSYNEMKVQIESIDKKVAQAKQAAYDAEASARYAQAFHESDLLKNLAFCTLYK